MAGETAGRWKASPAWLLWEAYSLFYHHTLCFSGLYMIYVPSGAGAGACIFLLCSLYGVWELGITWDGWVGGCTKGGEISILEN